MAVAPPANSAMRWLALAALALALALLAAPAAWAQETSCQGRCGQAASAAGDCGCDPLCQQLGDCCSDYSQACAGDASLAARLNSGGLAGELRTNLGLLRNALNDDQYHLAVYFKDFFATQTNQARVRVKDWVSQYNWCAGACRADWLLDYLYTAIYDRLWTLSLPEISALLEQGTQDILAQVMVMAGALPSYACTSCLVAQSDGPHAALGEYLLSALGYLAAQRGLALIPSSATTTTTTYTTTTTTTTAPSTGDTEPYVEPEPDPDPDDGETEESYLRRGRSVLAGLSPFRAF